MDDRRRAVAEHPGLPAGGQGGHRHRHHVVAPEGEQPADRAGEGELRVVPAHVLRRPQRADHLDSAPASTAGAARPASNFSTNTVASSARTSSTGTPCERAKPCSALLGVPSAAYAATIFGPLTRRTWSSSRAATSFTTAISRRGVATTRMSPWVSRVAAELGGELAHQLGPGGAGLAGRHLLGADLEHQGPRPFLRGGRRRRPGRGQRLDHAERVAQLVALGHPQPGHVAGQPAHPAELGRAVRGGDRAARVQHVEGLRALQHVRVGGHRQALVDQALRLGRVQLEQLAVGRHVGVVQVVAGHLVLGLAEHLAVADARRRTRCP